MRSTRGLAQYFWADGAQDHARALIPLLPEGAVPKILRHLASDFWEHRGGWPDFLARRDEDWAFIGVRAPRRRLSEEQRRWIADNVQDLSLPYRLVRVVKGARP